MNISSRKKTLIIEIGMQWHPQVLKPESVIDNDEYKENIVNVHVTDREGFMCEKSSEIF